VNAATITPADIAREGHAALHVAMERADRAEVTTPIIALADALSAYEELDADALLWESAWPHLSGEADPNGAALLKAAEDVASATENLIAALAAMSGTEDELKCAVAGVGTTI
jgi:hypothetical protein